MTDALMEYYLLSISGNSGEQATVGRKEEVGIPEIIFVHCEGTKTQAIYWESREEKIT